MMFEWMALTMTIITVVYQVPTALVHSTHLLNWYSSIKNVGISYIFKSDYSTFTSEFRGHITEWFILANTQKISWALSSRCWWRDPFKKTQTPIQACSFASIILPIVLTGRQWTVLMTTQYCWARFCCP